MGEMTDENLHAIDISKFMYSIIVVSIHTRPVANKTMIYGLWWEVALTAVPFYFLTCGYFLQRKLSDGGDRKRILMNQITKYAKLYIILSLIYLPIAIWFYCKNLYNLRYGIKLYLMEFFFKGEHYNSFILWFLLSAVYTLAALYLTSGLSGRRYYLHIFIVLFFALYILLKIIVKNEDLKVSVRLFNGCIYIPTGMIIYDLNQRKKILSSNVRIASIMALMIIGYFLTNNQTSLECLCYLLASLVFCSVILLKSRIKSNTVYLREMSKVIYCFHLLIWTVFCLYLYQKMKYGFIPFIFTLIISMAAGAICLFLKGLFQTKVKSMRN